MNPSTNQLFRKTDKERIDRGVQLIQGNYYDEIKMDCFSKEEADGLSAYVNKKHPGLKIWFTWNVFK